MCCIFLTLVLLGPRLSGVIWWIAEPDRWDEVFSSFIWPVLGLLFLPWTTLMYVIVDTHGVAGFEWLWLAIAALADLAMYGGGYQNREQAPGYPFTSAA
jgi:hypothetical protein